MQTLITVLNVNKKFSQTDKFSRPWFSQNRRQNFGSGAAKKKPLSLKIPIHDSHEENTVPCSTLALYVANRGIDVVIIGVTQQR